MGCTQSSAPRVVLDTPTPELVDIHAELDEIELLVGALEAKCATHGTRN